jgi:hypothetical protein
MSVWTVTPDVVTIDNLAYTDDDGIEHKFWIKLKKKLNVGERRAVQTAGWKGVGGMGTGGQSGEPEIRIDWKLTTFAKVEAWLVEWSLEDDRHNRLKINQATLQSLDEDVYDIIETAVDAHVTRLEEEKKARTGSRQPSATSA